MTMHTKVAGAWQTVTAPAVKVMGTWQNLTEGYVKVSGSWRLFFSASSVLAWAFTPGNLYSQRIGAGSLTSGISTGSPTGGTAPYTYAWTYISGNSFTIDSPTAAGTTFTTVLPAGIYRSGVYRLTVTDAVAASISFDITVELESL